MNSLMIPITAEDMPETKPETTSLAPQRAAEDRTPLTEGAIEKSDIQMSQVK